MKLLSFLLWGAVLFPLSVKALPPLNPSPKSGSVAVAVVNTTRFGYGFAPGVVSSEVEASAKVSEFCRGTTGSKTSSLAALDSMLRAQLFDYLAGELRTLNPQIPDIAVPSCIQREEAILSMTRNTMAVDQCFGKSAKGQGAFQECVGKLPSHILDRRMIFNFQLGLLPGLKIIIDEMFANMYLTAPLFANKRTCSSSDLTPYEQNICTESLSTLRRIQLSAPMFFDDNIAGKKMMTLETKVNDLLSLCTKVYQEKKRDQHYDYTPASTYGFALNCVSGLTLKDPGISKDPRIMEISQTLSSEFDEIKKDFTKRLSQDAIHICDFSSERIISQYPQVASQLVVDSNLHSLKKYQKPICTAEAFQDLVLPSEQCGGVKILEDDSNHRKVEVSGSVVSDGHIGFRHFFAVWDKKKDTVVIEAPVYFALDNDVKVKDAQNFLHKQEIGIKENYASWIKKAFCSRQFVPFEKCKKLTVFPHFSIVSSSDKQLPPVVKLHQCWDGQVADCNLKKEDRPDAANWIMTQKQVVSAHEFSHILGRPDEYFEFGKYDSTLSGEANSLMNALTPKSKLSRHHFEEIMALVKWCSPNHSGDQGPIRSKESKTVQ